MSLGIFSCFFCLNSQYFVLFLLLCSLLQSKVMADWQVHTLFISVRYLFNLMQMISKKSGLMLRNLSNSSHTLRELLLLFLFSFIHYIGILLCSYIQTLNFFFEVLVFYSSRFFILRFNSTIVSSNFASASIYDWFRFYIFK